MSPAAVFASFFFLVLVGAPIAVALGLTGAASAWWAGFPMVLIPTRFFSSLDNFSLLAAPFYIFAGEIMNRGGITETLITFAARLTRKIRGGAAYANIMASVFFAGISGTAIADTAALGKIFINGMPKQGYTREFSAAVTVASSMIGPIIPPSVIMIVYASVAQVSIINLFIAGIVPGLLMGLACAVVVFLTGMTGKGLPKGEIQAVEKSGGKLAFESLLVFTVPLFIVVGTLSGAFTATEAGGVACVYAMFLGVFVLRTLGGRSILDALRHSMRTTSVLYLVVAGASVLSYVLTVTGAVNGLRDLADGFAGNPTIFLFFILAVLLIAGFFLEPGVQVLLLAPIFLPMARALGIDEMQFAMIFLLSGTLSLMTPPVGICLFVAAQIGEIPIGRMFKAILPFLVAQIVAISLLILFPELVTFLPNLTE
ncbi:TRAP transporter large permease [Pseudoroseicyclus aestuarii]|uniref:TRAP transporter large permease protein n=1 Tax=Pseudoroseicyclus aestuarii TaxID=1795041 RepID=A0A318T3T1_9RHOB|nr:TRAP transporter large permease [Pseudoroseicyclus aestuarii]PYE84904.1 tripartite ATP-independent transporter DctM subunit [Pseudoroseicyclus aestuarii]